MSDLRVRAAGHDVGAQKYGYQPDIITTAKG
jgi:adenosylmethionine-8-amino-7-oxononanoate aminotransferase